MVFMSFVLVNVAVCYGQVTRVKREALIKKVTQIGTCKTDIHFHKGVHLIKLGVASLIGGLAGSLLGLGGAVVFNPVLIRMGLHP